MKVTIKYNVPIGNFSAIWRTVQLSMIPTETESAEWKLTDYAILAGCITLG